MTIPKSYLPGNKKAAHLSVCEKADALMADGRQAQEQFIGIALASDVPASAINAYTYGKNKNLDIRNGLVMMSAVLIFTLVGSFIASIFFSLL